MRKMPEWLLFGILIFPVVIIISLIVGLFTKDYFLWLTIPAIVFEQMFERCCTAFSNSQVANIIFAILIWFVIGAALGKSAFFSAVFKK